MCRQILTEMKGSLARIGPNHLLTDGPEIIKRMSSVRSTYTRSSWYSTLGINLDGHALFTELDTRIHDKMRAQMANAYTKKENPQLESNIDEQINSFVDLIRRKYISSGSDLRPLDLARRCQLFTLDVITRIAYGYALGFLSRDGDVDGYIEFAEQLIPYTTALSILPWAHSMLNQRWVRKLLNSSPYAAATVGKLMS